MAEKGLRRDNDLILTIEFDLIVENPFLTSHIRNPFSYDTFSIYIEVLMHHLPLGQSSLYSLMVRNSKGYA